MKEYDDYSAKEKKQLAVCQRLITEKSYLSQEEIRRDLQNHGFDSISQSTVSRLLKLLGVIKIRNTKGQKIYSVNPQLLPTPDAGRSVAEMVLSVEHNGEFILIHTVAGYGRAVARILDFPCFARNSWRDCWQQYRLGRTTCGKAHSPGAQAN